MRADTAVDNDSSTLGLLLLHVSEGLSSAEVRSGQVDIDRSLPVGQLLFCQRDVGGRDTGVAKDKVDTAELFRRLLEDSKNNVFLGNVSGDEETSIFAACGFVEKCDGLLQLRLTSTCDGDVPAGAGEGYRSRSSKLRAISKMNVSTITRLQAAQAGLGLTPEEPPVLSYQHFQARAIADVEVQNKVSKL